MTQLNTIPQFSEPLEVNKATSKHWYFFLQGIWTGLPPENVSTVTITASPFTYAPTRKGTFFVAGGTVSLVRFSRDGTTYYDTGATAGPFPLNAADRIEVTYSVAPTLTFVPS